MLYAKFRGIELKRTVKECARAAGLNRANYTHIEKGRMIATAAELQAIAKVLGVGDPRQLLVGVDAVAHGGEVMKPAALTVRVDSIPNALKAEHRWCLWRYREDDKSGRWVKIPRQIDRRYAASDNPTTWAAFEDVAATYQASSHVCWTSLR
jgi:transcriptional regulator with XRE-family HTH domain